MPTQQHIRVKFFSPSPQWLRMFPGREPVWGNCRFIFNQDEQHYDWLVVYGDLHTHRGERITATRVKLQCPPEHTLLITTEPSSITTYGSDFLNQFGYVLTGQEDWAIKHPGKIHSQPALRWFYGNARECENSLDYDFMKANPPESKSMIISTVCSTKAQKHTMHYKRAQFIERMCKALPEMDRFGRGIKEVNDKAETLDAYRYHIAIENHVCDHWWTEKLSDAFLGMTLPFYHGAPNASEYFPKDSFIPINIFDFEASLKTIRSAIDNNEFEKRLPLIREARSLVLEKYNIFAVLSELIAQHHSIEANPESDRYLYPRRLLRRNPIIAIRVGLEKTAMRIKTLLHQQKMDV
ncbi:MAG: glycosyltransferase [Verrucomicrobia bacterium]|nr:MAG: glycosyltransferase [Verrucomicrobiota bacterium]